MKKYILFLFFVMLYFLGFSNNPLENIIDRNTFVEDEYDFAIEKSKKEQKLVFIDFYAKWCTPCNWMEKNTLSDLRVEKLLKEKYITVKIDIDDFDGFDLKEKYQIKVLPTLIFLNSEGKIIKRIDETMGADKFLSIIEQQSIHVTPNVFPINTSPFTMSQKLVKKPISENLPIETINVFKQNKRIQNHLALQVGFFKNEENAKLSLIRIKKLINLPAKILVEQNDSYTVFRVVIGSFNSMDDANRYKYKMLHKHGIESIIL